VEKGRVSYWTVFSAILLSLTSFYFNLLKLFTQMTFSIVRPITSLFLFILLLVSFSLQAQSELPDVTIKTMDGKPVKLEEAIKKGKITVLNFWATWCNPCKKELDTIKDLYEDWQDEYDVEFIAVSIDDVGTLRKVKPMVAQRGWEYTIYTDEQGDLKRALNFQTIPQTFLLDQNRKIVYSHNGYVAGDEYELEEQIAKLAKK
jgi:cytochrome c biogenesis protein CcmG, thiol:disulfide interchange protein DsbE